MYYSVQLNNFVRTIKSFNYEHLNFPGKELKVTVIFVVIDSYQYP